MEKSQRSPTEFMDSLPPAKGEVVRAVHEVLNDAMVGHAVSMWEGKMWGGTDQEIIGYGDLSYERPSGVVEWFIVGLAAQKNHYSVYVNAVDGDGYLPQRYAKRLGRVEIGSASIGFKSLDDIDLTVLREVVAHAAKFTH